MQLYSYTHCQIILLGDMWHIREWRLYSTCNRGEIGTRDLIVAVITIDENRNNRHSHVWWYAVINSMDRVIDHAVHCELMWLIESYDDVPQRVRRRQLRWMWTATSQPASSKEKNLLQAYHRQFKVSMDTQAQPDRRCLCILTTLCACACIGTMHAVHAV